MRLGSYVWPELDGGAYVLVLPLGSTEQHGPHLPLDTDTRIAVALADELAARRESILVAPALMYGASWEHVGFAGTLAISVDVLANVLVEIVRSAGPEIERVVFVNGHGGNSTALARAVEVLVGEGRPAQAWAPIVRSGDAHAGRTETALLLAIDPEAVRVGCSGAWQHAAARGDRRCAAIGRGQGGFGQRRARRSTRRHGRGGSPAAARADRRTRAGGVPRWLTDLLRSSPVQRGASAPPRPGCWPPRAIRLGLVDVCADDAAVPYSLGDQETAG